MLPLKVKHSGSGSPWPIFYPAISKGINSSYEVLRTGKYVIRLGMIIYYYNNESKSYEERRVVRAGFKQTLYPGHAEEVSFPLYIDRDSPDGLYLLRISPFQEGVGCFFQFGDSPLDIMVEKRGEYIYFEGDG